MFEEKTMIIPPKDKEQEELIMEGDKLEAMKKRLDDQIVEETGLYSDALNA